MSEFDDIEGFARANRRRAKMYGVIGMAVFVIPLAWVFYDCHKKHQRIAERNAEYRKSLELTPEEREILKKRVTEVKARIAEQQDAWKKVVTHEALAALKPSESPCTMHKFEAPTVQAADSYVQYGSIDANYFGSYWVSRIRAGESFGVPYASDLQAVQALEKKLVDGTADRNDQRSLDLENVIPFMVVEKESAPLVTSSGGLGGFIPGELAGRVYVYSAASHSITCVADIAVTNSESIRFNYSYMEGNYADKEYKMREAGKAQLERDLDVKLRQAIATQLRAVAN
jgi:hypothetical protein